MLKRLQDKNARDEVLTMTFGQTGVTADSITAYVGAVAGVDKDFLAMGGVALDGIASEDNVFAKIVTDAMLSAVETTPSVTVDAIEAGLDTAKMIMHRALNGEIQGVSLDEVGNMTGASVVANLISANIYSVVSSSVNGLSGSIADIEPSSDGKGKYLIHSVKPVVSKGMGDIPAGTEITPMTVGDTMASFEREEIQVFVTDTLGYEFNLKASPADATNAELERGKNYVYVDGVELNDFSVEPNETAPTRSKVVGGITYTAVFNYATGKINLTISGNITSGENIMFSGTLSTKDQSAGTGEIEIDMTPATYTARPMRIGAKSNSLLTRRVLTEGRVNINSMGIGVVAQKMQEEIKAKIIRKGFGLAKQFNDTVIDLSDPNGKFATRVEAYKAIVVAIDDALATIREKSSLGGVGYVYGGLGFEKLINALSDKNNGVVTASNDNSNGIRSLGMINDKQNATYVPNFDTLYPTSVAGTYNLMVVLSPADPKKRAVLTGTGLPFLLEKPVNEKSGDEIVPISGEPLVEINKDANSRKLVMKITFKL